MACRDKISKFFLLVINSLLIAVGVVLLAIGIWIGISPTSFAGEVLQRASVLYQSDSTAQQLSQLFINNSTLLMVGCYMMLAVGGFLLLVGLCGCCGALKQSKCLLGLYAAVSVLCFIVILAAGIVEAVFQNQVTTYIDAGLQLLQSQQFDGMGNSGNALSAVWYSIMQGFSCCGLNGPSDFTQYAQTEATLWSKNRQTCTPAGQCFGMSSNSSMNGTTPTVLIPASCCMMSVNNTAVLLNSQCPYNLAGSFNGSCYDYVVVPFSATLQKYSHILMAITFGLDVVCLLAIVAAAILLHDLGNKTTYA